MVMAFPSCFVLLLLLFVDDVMRFFMCVSLDMCGMNEE